MAITLRNLDYLVALAEEGHFGRAAERVAISQPALSQQIRELEAHFGQKLVERGRTIRLTRAGRVAVERARAILLDVRELEETVRRTERLSGPLRLGIIPTVAPYLLPHLLPQVSGQGLELTVQEALTDRLTDALGTGRLDAAIAALPLDGAGIEGVALFEDRFLLASSARDPVTAPVRPEEVAADRLLLLDEGHCLADQALAVCNLRRGRAALGAASLTTLARLVAEGHGITLMPEIAAHVEGQGLALRPFAGIEPHRTIGLLRRAGSGESPWFEELAAAVRSAANAIPRPVRPGAHSD